MEIKYIGKLAIDSEYVYDNSPLKNKVQEVEYVNLNKKVQEFILCYCNNMIKDNYNRNLEYKIASELKDAIDSVAVCFELSHPDLEIDNLINEIENNINSNINYFISLLPEKYQKYMRIKKFPSNVLLETELGDLTLYLDNNGLVQDINNKECLHLDNMELNNIHVRDLVVLLVNRNVQFKDNNQVVKIIKENKIWNAINQKFLECVMYRIIERGGSRIGPRRGLLFAKEFRMDINIPMMYGIDYKDPELMNLINKFIYIGGNKDLMCFEGYFDKNIDDKSIKTVSLSSIIDEYGTKKLVK